MPKHIVIVGAGLGGLAAGLRLAHEGHSVTILEKTDQVGGRNRRVQVNGCDFDGGPTLVMMLDPFRKLFADVGERIEHHLALTLCDPGYRAFFADGTRIEATPNMAMMVAQIQKLNPKDARTYPKFLGDLAELYKDSIPNFVEKNYYSPFDFFGLAGLAKVAKHKMLGNLAKRVATYIGDPRLRMLLSFQTMYLGLSPFEAPWVYATLTYMEFGEGIWYPKGGVPAISESIGNLATSKGAEIRLNSPVSRIDGKALILESGEIIEADAVICNADLPYAERELQRLPHRRRKHSCSTYMIYADYKGSIPELLHHNVFFGRDFYKNLDQIFNKNELPDHPAFYASISNRTEPSRSPEGHENLYFLIPCPNLDRPWSDSDACDLQEKAFDRLEKETSFSRDNVRAAKFCTPQDWQSQLNLDKGAAFGLSHHFKQSAYLRPANRSKSNPNLYFVGASTVPGNGMPMVLISADLAVQRMKHDGLI
ncbi:MAG: phytoene desaturase [Chlorobia bacterium]|nr:phytoene desaturase [Fimbriimonadaceae bacterium]